MHSERDILTKTVFPLLRSKLAPYLINVHEIDLRWGITETEANNNQTLEICLNQVKNCDYFISILGDRYGHVLPSYPKINDQPWLQSYSVNSSITELEIECQLNKSIELNRERAFFYFRDNSFMKEVPEDIRPQLTDISDDQAWKRLNDLKMKLRTKSLEINENYHAKWLKIDGQIGDAAARPLLTGLDGFAKQVFENLFNTIMKHEVESGKDEVIDCEGMNWCRVNSAYLRACADLFR